jgi:hypothetical protein
MLDHGFGFIIGPIGMIVVVTYRSSPRRQADRRAA